MCAGLFYVVGQLPFGKQHNDFSEFFVGSGGDQERNGQVFFQCGLYLFYLHFHSSGIDRIVFSA